MINRVISNLPIMRDAYVTLLVLATVFSMAWYKIVMQRFLMVYHGISQWSLVFSGYTRSPKVSCVNTKKKYK